MNNEQEYHLARLTERQLNGSISDSEFAELEAALLDSSEARQLYLDLTHQHARLQMMGDSLVQEELQSVSVLGRARIVRHRLAWAICGTAAALVLGLLGWWQLAKPSFVATLVSSEYAAWESSLPTTPGAQLKPGFLKLESGVAAIRFHSGAEVFLEAPAHLVLETPMRARLLAGSAVVNVPEEAIGFMIETPNGYAVDHGTEFAVSVDEAEQKTLFEVLSGEISVHHPATGRTARLDEKRSVVVTAEALTSVLRQSSEAPIARETGIVRIAASRETSIIGNDRRDEFLHADFLMAKLSSGTGEFTRRALFGFDLSQIDMRQIESARIRLNLVPSGMGLAAHLPVTNTFAIYGLTDESAENWTATGLRWNDAPQLDQCQPLGTFDVPRGKQTGSFTLENAALLTFLKADTNGHVSFLLTRQTPERKFRGLVHAFASSHHPQASGPSLEIAYGQSH